MPPRRLLIVAHAPSPNTRQLLDAVVAGARSPEIGDVEVRVTPPLQAGADDVLAAEALILGTTENLGYMSGALKDFFDRIYYPCLEKTQGLPYALYIRAGHDGTGTRRGVETIVTGLRWRAVREPLICRGEWAPSSSSSAANWGCWSRRAWRPASSESAELLCRRRRAGRLERGEDALGSVHLASGRRWLFPSW